MHLYNVPDWKCDVIPNGIIPRQFRSDIDAGEVKRGYGIHPFAPLILFIGRLVYQKGPDLLIEAMKIVCPESPGRYGNRCRGWGYASVSHGRAQDLPVNFVGYIPDSEYIRLLNACDLVVIPSRNEPFVSFFWKPGAPRKGFVASNVGGLSETSIHLLTD